MISWQDVLALGRVSNLPTVWSNLVAGLVLSAGLAFEAGLLLLAGALSLLYIGGMYLNDAFDAEIDAKERPERAIPSGRVGRSTVFGLGFGLLGAGIALLAFHGISTPDGNGFWPAAGGLALAATIVIYDWNHKGNPFSPVVMGLCRVLVYVTAALSVTAVLPEALLIGAALMLSYLIGLTYIAKQENLNQVANIWPLGFLGAPIVFGAAHLNENSIVLPFWLALTFLILIAVRFIQRKAPGDIPRAVMSLIAGISLLDAMLIAVTGDLAPALFAVAMFALTLAFQKIVSGT